MNILLIYPSQNNVYGVKIPPPYPPLGLLYLAAVLEKSSSVEILIFDTDIKDINEFKEIIKTNNYDLVMISSVTSTIKHSLYLAETVKEINQNIPILIGGIHPTIAPQECIENKNVDFICIGEGENTIVEFVNESQKKSPDYSKINGIAYKNNEEIFINEPRELEQNLDKFPFPARHLLKNPKKFIPPDAENMPVTPIFLTRGCPGQCTYCCTKQIFGRKMRFRSVKNIIEEFDEIEKAGYKEIHILDDCFTFDKTKVIELCNAIKEKKYSFQFEISNGLRADMVNYEVLNALKSIAVKNVGFGIESGNEQILKNIKKGISKDKVRESVKISHDLGLETWGFFIVGLPGETVETIKDTIKFAKELDIDFAKFLILKPYPGSEIFNELFAKNLIDNFNYENYGIYTAPVHHLEEMSSKDILYWQKRAFFEFYFRPKKIIQHLSRIKNLTILKLTIKGALFVLANIFKKYS